MRIVSWNCRLGGEHDGHLTELAPDIAVISEWGRLPHPAPASASSFVEFGEVGEFGLGVAGFGEWHVSRAVVPGITGGVIGAVEVRGPVECNLVAVWSCLSGRPKENPLVEAVKCWSEWLARRPIIVAGDFNTGGSWADIRTGPMSHFPIIDRLRGLGLHSAYHAARGVEQGVGEEPTLWHSNGKTYMVDHVFTPTGWPILSVEVGSEDPWRQRSDHAPLVVELDVCP